jgi:hypothetical protein
MLSINLQMFKFLFKVKNVLFVKRSQFYFVGNV